MSKKKKKNAGENFLKMFIELGGAIGEIFNDPKLKAKARQLGVAVEESAKTFAHRFENKKVQGKFKKAGSTAKVFGKQMEVEGKKFGSQMGKLGKQLGQKVEKQVKEIKKKSKTKPKRKKR